MDDDECDVEEDEVNSVAACSSSSFFLLLRFDFTMLFFESALDSLLFWCRCLLDFGVTIGLAADEEDDEEEFDAED